MALRYGDRGLCMAEIADEYQLPDDLHDALQSLEDAAYDSYALLRDVQVGPPQVSGARAVLQLALWRDKREGA